VKRLLLESTSLRPGDNGLPSGTEVKVDKVDVDVQLRNSEFSEVYTAANRSHCLRRVLETMSKKSEAQFQTYAENELVKLEPNLGKGSHRETQKRGLDDRLRGANDPASRPCFA
jgi:hypothetical protein